jgi:hypothetical protein
VSGVAKASSRSTVTFRLSRPIAAQVHLSGIEDPNGGEDVREGMPGREQEDDQGLDGWMEWPNLSYAGEPIAYLHRNSIAGRLAEACVTDARLHPAP